MPIFDDIDELIKRQMEVFRRMFTDNQFPEVSDQPQIEEKEGVRTYQWGPIVYGRTTTMGPDGRVQTQEWGNLPEEARQHFEEFMNNFSFSMPPPLQRRPISPIPDPFPPDQPFPGPQPQLKQRAEDYMIDVIDTKEGYVAIFDTPAIDTSDVEARVKGQRLQLWVQGRIFRELELPVPVELTALHFKNGVVELRLKSKKPDVESTATGETTN